MLKLQEKIIEIISNSLIEDNFDDDVTSDNCINDADEINFSIIAKERIIFCGQDIIRLAFDFLQKNKKFKNKKVNISYLAKDGDVILKNDIIVKGYGNAKLIFAGERVILNLIQHLSGIATLTNKFIIKLNSKKIKILDTRKTIPNIRLLQKYAVTVGGGNNHRFSLADMILIKDNHIALNGGIKETLKKFDKSDKKIEIECDNINQVKEALYFNPEVIMLDNMNSQMIKKCSELIRNHNKKIKIEISGGINLKNISKFTNLDIDFISIGFLTHSVQAADISLECFLKND